MPTCPANTLDQATTVVQKIASYETTAPAPPGDDFYFHATIGAFFQGTGPREERGYILSAERMREGMRARGYTVDRLYFAAANADPQQFKDQTPLPDEIRKPGFAWNAGSADWITAWNAGRSVIVHRDHGSKLGIANPGLNVNDVPSLTNGAKLPVFFSINCTSARFDDPGSPSFVEQVLHTPAGGAVGAFGDTRASPTSQNDNLAVGFGDALFPATIPNAGLADPLRHMGEVLIAGKATMGGQAPAEQQLTGAVGREHLLWHYFGDPSMELWQEAPLTFTAPELLRQDINPDPPIGSPAFRVHVATTQPGVEGAQATLRHNGTVIGRALIANGEALISPSVRTDSGGLTLALQQDRFLQAEFPVGGAAPTHTIQCPPAMTATNVNSQGQVLQNGGPVRDGLVRLRYTKPSGQTTSSALTDSNGEWHDTASIGPNDHGAWKLEAFFEDKGVRDAVCDFQVP